MHRTSSPKRRPGRRCAALGACSIAVWFAPPSLAQPDVPEETTEETRIDPETGRDLRVWPPDRPFDHLRMVLEIDIPDMAEPTFSAVQTVTLRPVAEPQTGIALDAGPALSVSSVRLDGREVPFEHDAEAESLRVRFERAVAPGKTVSLRIEYTAERPGGRGAGMTFSGDDPRTPEADFSLHTQGEAESNHLWFPCHDFPNERVATELIVTVPAPYEAVSNGKLVNVERHAALRGGPDGPGGRLTYHWRQEMPHPYYLVVLVVGRFDVVNVGGPDSAYPGLWMPVYAPLGAGEAARQTFGNTAEIVRFFEDRFGIRYPWEKLAQVMCRDFAAGGMENTSAITYHAALVRGRRGSADDIIAHEVAHQWFGNLLNCRTWEHAWLNEGFATLAEALWAEHERGYSGYLNVLQRSVSHERFASYERRAPADPPMNSAYYANPDGRFVGPDSVYHKGAAILHMLRMRLGDETFFAGARRYLERYQYSAVETDDLRLVMEEVSGQSLERFFDQWCRRPGLPSLSLDYAWSPASASDADGPGTLRVMVEQTQAIDADNPAYAFQLPLRIALPEAARESRSSGSRWAYLTSDTRTATASIELPARPLQIDPDPNMTVLSRTKVRTPLEATPVKEPAQ